MADQIVKLLFNAREPIFDLRRPVLTRGSRKKVVTHTTQFRPAAICCNLHFVARSSRNNGENEQREDGHGKAVARSMRLNRVLPWCRQSFGE